MNDRELQKALNSSNSINIKLKVINIDDNINEINIDKVIYNLTFDKIWDSYFFIKGLINLKRKFGKDVIIISGQGSDSIFSFGPTEFSVGSFFTRFIIYYPFNFFSKFLCFLNNLKNKKSYKSPTDSHEYYYAFLDEYRYKPLIRDFTFKLNINGLIQSSFFKGLNFRNKLFYLKIFGFIQGKDNSGNVWLSKSIGMNNIILPFMSQRIIESIIRYKNNFTDLFLPKYLFRIFLYKNYPKLIFMFYSSDKNISKTSSYFYSLIKKRFEKLILEK